jgi:hypothetical protein
VGGTPSDSSRNPLDVISDDEDPPAEASTLPVPTSPSDNSAALARSSTSDIFTLPSRAPATLREALAGPAAREWGAACQAEMDALTRMRTYELVPRSAMPHDRKTLKPKWVFALKHDAQGRITKHKARLVVRGFAQVPGLDYKETFSPVLRFSSLRILLALAAHHGWHVHQLDTNSAFLNGDLEEEIYMEQPEGYTAPGKEDWICRLLKALYGLKQGGCQWYKKICAVLTSLGFTQSRADPCVFILIRNNLICILGLYVDDKAIIGNNLEFIEHVKDRLKCEFDMKDLGEAEYILGVQIKRDHTQGTLSLSQRQYLLDVLSRFNMADCNPVSTPIEAGLKLQHASPGDPRTDAPYQQVLGSLMYAACGTRPDLSFTVSYLSQFSSHPTQAHWAALKRVLRYVKGTVDLCLTYHRSRDGDGASIHGFSDSDYGNHHRSVMGYTFILAKGAVTWSSNRIPNVTLSSSESEYIGLTNAAKEAVWLRSFFSELRFKLTTPTLIYGDNQAAISIARNQQYHTATKHVAIKWHWIREVIESSEVKVEHVPTGDMTADIFTKGLERIKHVHHVEQLGLRP